MKDSSPRTPEEIAILESQAQANQGQQDQASQHKANISIATDFSGPVKRSSLLSDVQPSNSDSQTAQKKKRTTNRDRVNDKMNKGHDLEIAHQQQTDQVNNSIQNNTPNDSPPVEGHESNQQQDLLCQNGTDQITNQPSQQLMLLVNEELPKLTEREATFVLEYCRKPRNGKNAVIKAGYDCANPYVKAVELKNRSNINRAIELVSASFLAEAILTVDEAKRELTEMALGNRKIVKKTMGFAGGTEFEKTEESQVDPIRAIAELNKLQGAYPAAKVQMEAIHVNFDLGGDVEPPPAIDVNVAASSGDGVAIPTRREQAHDALRAAAEAAGGASDQDADMDDNSENDRADGDI